MSILRPQITSETNILTTLVSPVATRTGMMLGSAQWGPMNKVVNISDLSDFVSNFGNDVTGTGLSLIKGADLFFRNGGALKVLRLDDGSADYSDYTAKNTTTDVLQFKGKYKGTYGNTIALTIIENDSNRDIEITDGKIIEVFNNNGSGYSTNQDIANAINATSSLVTVNVETGQSAMNLVDTLIKTYLTGGLDGAALDIINYTTAFENILLTEDFDFLLIPGLTTDSDINTMVGKLNSRATTEKKYARYFSGVNKDETITTALSRTSAGSRLSLFAPNVKYTHRIDDTEVILDGSYLACAAAGKLCSQDVELSGTHKTINVEGLSVLESTGKQYYSKLEQEQLLQGKIIPVTLINNSVQIVREITRNSSVTSPLFEGNIVSIIDEVTTQVETYLNSVIGEPNTVINRDSYEAGIDAILTSLKNLGVLESFNKTQIVEGSSRDTFNATISIKPAFSTNFIKLTINVS